VKFGLIGAAGFIAPRHIAAIHTVGGDLVAACDYADSVGHLDALFPDVEFFQSPAAFYSCCQRRGVDCIVVCTPNYRHTDHVIAGLRIGADVLCEKPLVLSGAEAVALQALEGVTGRRVWTVLQLRHLPVLRELRVEVQGSGQERYRVDVEYTTRRGRWYDVSWKGDPNRSGGVAANIGAHLFDLLTWVFGPAEAVEVEAAGPRFVRGSCHLRHADAHWTLSVDAPMDGTDARRCLQVRAGGAADRKIDLSPSFRVLHTEVYRALLRGEGCGIDDVLPGLTLMEYAVDAAAHVGATSAAR
jgi:UDP-N-acetyl-2-amino-2-deoxyglucuronate dehydrogenase